MGDVADETMQGLNEPEWASEPRLWAYEYIVLYDLRGLIYQSNLSELWSLEAARAEQYRTGMRTWIERRFIGEWERVDDAPTLA